MFRFRQLAACIFATVALWTTISGVARADEQAGSPPDSEMRCTTDGSACIRLGTYIPDVCALIETTAIANRLDPNFLARLLWQESRFEPGAISPVGAQGIAQFMPSTAALYDLEDPFNPAQAIFKAGWYLRHLTDRFGSIGLAAIAYNGGENRAARFIAGQAVLPYETLDYVEAITGHDALTWRDNPPKPEELKLALHPDKPFREACESLGGDRKLRQFIMQPQTHPWGVILASHPSQAGALQQVTRLNRTLRPLLENRRVGYTRKQMRGTQRMVYTAQVGFETRDEANRFCLRLKQVGGHCIVLANQDVSDR